MGNSAENSSIKADCPRCGKSHSATTLGALKKAVGGCCRKKRPRQKVALPTVEVDPPARPRPPALPFKLVIPRSIQSQNETTWAHWTKYNKDKRGWLRAIGPQLLPLSGLLLPYSVWRVERVFSGRRRQFDFANLVGGTKPLIDCLVDYRIITDDDPAHFKCDYYQFREDTNHTVLTLVEINDGPPPAKVRGF